MSKQKNAMDNAKEEERKREAREFMANMRTTRFAIMEQIKENGQENVNVSGVLARCPVCEVGQVRYTRNGRYNGHITAQCSTEGCVGWIE